jgi:hypothetical protein
LFKLPPKTRHMPVHGPEQRADRLPVAGSGITSALQTAAQHLSGRHAIRRFGQQVYNSGNAGSWCHQKNPFRGQARGR